VASAPSLHAQLDTILDRAVQIATGTLGAAKPATARPGQRKLSHAVLDNLVTQGNLASEAPTGSGKSFAVGVPAMLLAAERQERSVISTESLGLQAQLMEKDLPVMAQATKDILGVTPTFSVLKGWSNYVCALAACGVAEMELGVAAPGRPVNDPAALLAELRQDDSERVRTPLSHLVEWAIAQIVEERSGDRASLRPETFPGDLSQLTDDLWSSVSISPAECPSVRKCPFGEVCLPHAARVHAGLSDIVVTNHSMLAVQAATVAPVVIGNKSVGPINHLIVDEAHGLASTVRKQGAVSISAFGLHGILRSVERSLEQPAKAKRLREVGMDLFRQFDSQLTAFMEAGRSGGRSAGRSASHSAVVALPADHDPFEDLMSALTAWLKAAKALVPDPYRTNAVSEMRFRFAAIARISTVVGTIAAIQNSPKDYARWVEHERIPSNVPTGLERVAGAALRISPVDVGPMLRAALYEYQANPPARRGQKVGDADPVGGQSDEEEELLVLSVSAVSATLPQSVVYELGLRTTLVKYASPFTRSYRDSMLYIPKLSDDELTELTGPARGSKPKFDTGRHPAWAAPYVERLVRANGGSALVLSATTAAGRYYADYLTSHHIGVPVHSQWDGGPVRHIVDIWRDDATSVLVGTRSLMTGVDAPGGTCSLVIIDRVPRSAGNPVDDARVTRIMERMEIDRWAADRLVYVGDAALLMEQAAGRLIRSATDLGMVACLDPRLLKSSPLKYPEPTRKLLIGALDSFEQKVSSRDPAEAFLSKQKARSARKAAA